MGEVINIKNFRLRQRTQLVSDKSVNLAAKANVHEARIAITNEAMRLGIELKTVCTGAYLTLREAHLQSICCRALDLIERLNRQ